MITITPLAYADLILAYDLCPVEISGLGMVELCGENRVSNEIIVLPQRGSGGCTVLTEEDWGRHKTYLERQNRGEEGIKERLWWHSHVRGFAYPSGIDLGNIEFLGATTGRSQNPWWISIVGNKMHTLYVQLDIFWPRRETQKNLPIYFSEKCSRDELRRLYKEREPRMRKLIADTVEVIAPEED